MSLTDMPAPSIGRAASDPELSVEQWRFLWIHARRLVVRWQWYFFGSLLRVQTDDGLSASINRIDVDELVALGLMSPVGTAGYALTREGIRVAK